ncbi:44671_t:CDS:1, partial [Gigaspora margarita]
PIIYNVIEHYRNNNKFCHLNDDIIEEVNGIPADTKTNKATILDYCRYPLWYRVSQRLKKDGDTYEVDPFYNINH